ncbi:adenosine 3'-phospho 5'-phosphosulfate transporter 2 [Patella vulgata]|uniref:adenosine 3'-phospho 5'-phosphosulfate transporter 2 n=1 Tax=Patella vulgata TaxID=6465 RepID=UPI0024A8B72B|nr:adenosine 3'-phospho 5'-phosphosulfate transporter 2 [Patella vulgata]
MSRYNLPLPQHSLRQKTASSSNIISIPMMSASSPDSIQQKSSVTVSLMCFDISHTSTTVQFLLLTSATFFFYLIYGYMQELIFRLDGFRPFGMYLTLIQFACYVIFGVLELQFKEDKTRKIPIKTYFFLAFLTVSTMGLSNTSVGYLNYATQVIFKCCKLIPVLIGGILIQGKKFNIIDVSACVCMSLGLILFTLADSTVSPEFNLYGIILISLAVCADGVIGNVQEKTIKQHGASNCEVVLYSYGIGFLYILIFLIPSGQLLPAFKFCQKHPIETYGYVVIF